MKRQQKQIEAQQLALRLAPQCVALFELPRLMYEEAQKFGATSCPLSFSFCQKIVYELTEAGRL